jgi:hypothetical protein
MIHYFLIKNVNLSFHKQNESEETNLNDNDWNEELK